MARTQQTVYRLHEKKQLIDHLKQAGVSVRTEAGPARFVDGHTLELPDGTRLEGEKFILCLGGHARRLDFPGSEHALTHSDVWALQELPRSVAVVGAAATGCQLASIFDAFGAQVALLEVAPRILATEDEAVSAVIGQAFAGRGMVVETGIGGVDRIDKVDEGLRLTYRAGEEQRTLTADAVILAVGWIGNVEGLNLPAADVRVERGYVWVDDHFRTSAPHIFAAGDVTGRMMLVQSAGYEARVAAENAVLGAGQRYRHHIVPHGGFTDPEYGSVGQTEAQARQGQECVVATVPYGDMDRAVIDGRTEGFCKLVVSAESHRILGVHVVGEQALEVVQLVAGAMASDMWVEQLAELELAYPTFTAILGLAARQIVRDLGVLPLAPQWRTLSPLREARAEWEIGES
jgi:dihydrolipoamide dehydrogenase